MLPDGVVHDVVVFGKHTADRSACYGVLLHLKVVAGSHEDRGLVCIFYCYFHNCSIFVWTPGDETGVHMWVGSFYLQCVRSLCLKVHRLKTRGQDTIWLFNLIEAVNRKKYIYIQESPYMFEDENDLCVNSFWTTRRTKGQ